MTQYIKSLIAKIHRCWVYEHEWAFDETTLIILGPEYQAQKCKHCNKERFRRL